MLTEIKNDTYHYFVDERHHIQGEYKTWYWTGQIMEHCYCLDDSYHGEYKSWFGNGKLEKHCIYANGKLHGEFKQWHEHGGLYAHCFHINHTVVSFDEIPYPKTEEDRMYFMLKYNLQLLPLPLEAKC